MHFHRYATFILIVLLLIVNVSIGDGTGDKSPKDQKTLGEQVKVDDNHKSTVNDTSVKNVNKVDDDVNKPGDIKKVEEDKKKDLEPGKDTKSLADPGADKKSEDVGKNEADDAGQIPVVHTPTLNPGALKRASYVFVGLSILVVAYFMFRSFRLGKKPAQMVRKYGVLAHRQDIEMRPLPLDEEDDEDTTIFDVTRMSPQRAPHQPLSS